jgi:2-polyprenyl-3-methyl-5-hydroxy-6-metoxy-1,4-benzoquinol methylase
LDEEADRTRAAEIAASWEENAGAWTAVVRAGAIPSRRAGTDAAILAAVRRSPGRRVLDVGCGEGWLVRALGERGVRSIGVDAVPALVERAREAGGGEFRVASYEEIAAGGLDVRADVVVANFALIGRESVEGLVRGVPRLLAPGGAFIVQTLHPLIATGDLPYADGWRAGSWAGFDASFSDPAPWYFRTMESWVRLLVESGFRLRELREPLHPATGRPASVVFVAEPG